MGSKVVFEFPANPLVVPQTCLRFKDLEKDDCVGIKEWSKDNPGRGVGKGINELQLNQIFLLERQCNIEN